MAFQEGNVLDLDELSIEPGSRGKQHKTGELISTPTVKMGEHTPQRAKSGTRDVARCNLSPAMLLTGSLILGLIGEIRVLTET